MTEQEAANWMLEKLREDGFLYQETAAMQFAELEAAALSYYDSQGNLCVGKGVLKLFRAMTPEYVYERAGKFWRERLETDQDSRQQ